MSFRAITPCPHCKGMWAERRVNRVYCRKCDRRREDLEEREYVQRKDYPHHGSSRLAR